MSGSFVSYKGHTFEANDVLLQVWLHLILEEIPEESMTSEWTKGLIDEWTYQSRASLVGTVFPNLDSFAQDDQHRFTLISWCEEALDRLHEQGSVGKETLNRHNVGGKLEFTKDVAATKIVPIGEKFVRLLKRELVKSDE